MQVELTFLLYTKINEIHIDVKDMAISNHQNGRRHKTLVHAYLTFK